jgi:hypothetical protein
LTKSPIIVLGPPRSGTTLIARIIGSSDEVFLITEIKPHLKPRGCPEDRSAVSDHELWQDHFPPNGGSACGQRPICARPIVEPGRLESLRARYLEMAGRKRLVIKNPLGLTRVDMLKTMFPDATFVFSLRSPWPTIQSAIIKGNNSFIVPSDFVKSLPDDLMLRAAATWAESIDVLERARDNNWIVLRHEELVAKPHSIIAQLCERQGLTKLPLGYAARLPEIRMRDYTFIKYKLMRSSYRAEITSLLRDRASAFGYDANLAALPSSAFRFVAGKLLKRLRPRKPARSWKAEPILAQA